MRYILILMFIICQSHASELPNLNGMWTGSVAYKEGDAKLPIPCSVVFKQNHMTVLGRMLELQTFGNTSAVGLTSDLKGVLEGRKLSFVKTYDGSGGQTHSIAYILTVSEDGKTMSGTWSLNKELTGTATFSKIDPATLQNIDF